MTDTACPAAYGTRTFRTTAGDYFGLLLRRWVASYGWCLLLPAIAALGTGLIRGDVRWYLVALMVMFIMVPMAISMVYTYYMLTPHARRAILPKSVAVEPGRNIVLTYSLGDTSSDSGSDRDPDSGTYSGTGSGTGANVAPAAPAPETIPWQSVKGVTRTSRFTVYHLTGEGMPMLLIPNDSILYT